MATLVTGGTGCVGSNMVRELARRGHDVVCFDLVAPDGLMRGYVQPWAGRVAYVQGDILSRADLRRASSQHGITKIVHAAVYTPRLPEIELGDSRSIVDINLAGTANLLDLARDLSLDRFLYVSSASVYGGSNSNVSVTEDHPLDLRNLYNITKYASELLTRRYGELHGFGAVSVRVTFGYGPMERVTGHRTVMSVLYEWTGNVVRGEPIRLASRTPGRNYTYLADMAAGIATVLDAPSLSHDVYNVAPGHWTTLGEVIDALRELRPSVQVAEDLAVELDIDHYPPASVHGPLDVTRLREDLGFSTQYDIRAGLMEYLQWREAFSFRD